MASVKFKKKRVFAPGERVRFAKPSRRDILDKVPGTQSYNYGAPPGPRQVFRRVAVPRVRHIPYYMEDGKLVEKRIFDPNSEHIERRLVDWGGQPVERRQVDHNFNQPAGTEVLRYAPVPHESDHMRVLFEKMGQVEKRSITGEKVGTWLTQTNLGLGVGAAAVGTMMLYNSEGVSDTLYRNGKYLLETYTGFGPWTRLSHNVANFFNNRFGS